MNYLAHALLSGDDPEILIGNMAADSIKGMSLSALRTNVTRGVHLHRRIDFLTDNSDGFSACMSVFKPTYGRYAHVLADIAIDHLLIGNWGDCSKTDLHVFIEHVYGVLLKNHAILPHKFIPIADRMRREDWLSSYGTLAGVATAYERIACRLGMAKGHLEKAAPLIDQNREFLCKQFSFLFSALKEDTILNELQRPIRN